MCNSGCGNAVKDRLEHEYSQYLNEGNAELYKNQGIELARAIVYPFSGLVELIKGIVYSNPEFKKLTD